MGTNRTGRRWNQAPVLLRGMWDRKIGSYNGLLCSDYSLRDVRLVARQTPEGGHFLAIADVRLAYGIGQDGDVLIIRTTVNGERMAIFSTVRIGIIGPLPAGLLLIARIIGGIAMRSRCIINQLGQER